VLKNDWRRVFSLGVWLERQALLDSKFRIRESNEREIFEHAICFLAGISLVQQLEKLSVLLPLADLCWLGNWLPVHANKPQFIRIVIDVYRLFFAFPHDVVVFGGSGVGGW
jgi:hypothetical protein